ncbi:hypothetical protein ACFVGY_01880 [Streptomyces sp. NPDC127106]|uniref:hypothetical protein n=1 Tax=Streptomyces sp. NPDC127106 TaxID=3345360 RepID=UPI0036419999
MSNALRSGSLPRCAPGAVLEADAGGEDLQLALYLLYELLYELHYRGFDGVDDARGARCRWPSFHSAVYSRSCMGPYVAMRSALASRRGAAFLAL